MFWLPTMLATASPVDVGYCAVPCQSMLLCHSCDCVNIVNRRGKPFFVQAFVSFLLLQIFFFLVNVRVQQTRWAFMLFRCILQGSYLILSILYNYYILLHKRTEIKLNSIWSDCVEIACFLAFCKHYLLFSPHCSINCFFFVVYFLCIVIYVWLVLDHYSYC